MLGNRDVDRMLLMFCPAEFFLENKNRYVHRICDDTFWKMKLEKDFPLRSKYVYFSIPQKKLYFILVHHKSVIYESDYFDGEYDIWDFTAEYELMTDDYNKMIKDRFPKILRGDVVRFGGDSYRNNGKMIWNGERLIHLGRRADDYGNAPEEICFPEVPLDFYFNSIAHNKYIYITAEKATEIIKTGKLSDNYKYYQIEINSKIKPVKQIISFKEGCRLPIEWNFY